MSEDLNINLKEHLENIRRSADRGLSLAIKDDPKFVDLFQHILDLTEQCFICSPKVYETKQDYADVINPYILRYYGSQDMADLWWNTPNPIIGDVRPVEMLGNIESAKKLVKAFTYLEDIKF